MLPLEKYSAKNTLTQQYYPVANKYVFMHMVHGIVHPHAPYRGISASSLSIQGIPLVFLSFESIQFTYHHTYNTCSSAFHSHVGWKLVLGILNGVVRWCHNAFI